jgi:hypothetical protein
MTLVDAKQPISALSNTIWSGIRGHEKNSNSLF